MHFILATCGLPGAGYHGGAMLCWALLKHFRAMGHEVTVIGLIEDSAANPYRQYVDEQVEAIQALGAGVRLIQFRQADLEPSTSGLTGKLHILRRLAMGRSLEEMFPWRHLATAVRQAVEGIRPDGIVCYHFDALSSLWEVDTVPVLAIASDLWFLPYLFAWGNAPASLVKFSVNALDAWAYRRDARRHMLTMLGSCAETVTPMPHYLDWYHRHGVTSMAYAPTPVHDPHPSGALEMKFALESAAPRILLIGDLGGTSTQSGFDDLVRQVVPALDRAFGVQGYAVNVVGGGRPTGIARELENHPAVHWLGRKNGLAGEEEFLRANVLLVPNTISLGVRVRILTAFSHATCVVANRANAEGIPELVDGVNCLLADSGQELADKLLLALSDAGTRRRLAAGGRETFEQRFSENAAGSIILARAEDMVARWAEKKSRTAANGHGSLATRQPDSRP